MKGQLLGACYFNFYQAQITFVWSVINSAQNLEAKLGGNDQHLMHIISAGNVRMSLISFCLNYACLGKSINFGWIWSISFGNTSIPLNDHSCQNSRHGCCVISLCCRIIAWNIAKSCHQFSYIVALFCEKAYKTYYNVLCDFVREGKHGSQICHTYMYIVHYVFRLFKANG